VGTRNALPALRGAKASASRVVSVLPLFAAGTLLFACGGGDDDSAAATSGNGGAGGSATVSPPITAASGSGSGGASNIGSGGASGSAGVGGAAGSMLVSSGGAAGSVQAGGGGAAAIGGASGTSAGSGGMTAGTGGVAAGSGGTSAGSGGSAGSGAGNGGEDFDALRQLCVDTINMYRATMSLPALARETPDKEACSDMGAKQDADANRAHGSAGMCFMSAPYFGAGQNTCPSLPVGGFGGATLESSFKRCLQQMWDEGPPPAPMTIDQCIMDRAQGGCFLTHGHYINMIQTMYKSVSCGFYKKADGSYWANQDFPIKR